jgi:toxin ParE1/3/4
MNRYVLSPLARADIENIWDYTAENWGERQAERYAREIQRAIEAVAANPRKGRSCDDIRAGYHKYPVGSHILFFRVVDGVVDIVRILHQRMDFDRHL